MSNNCSGRGLISLGRGASAVLVCLLILGSVRSQVRKRLDPLKAPGKAFVASLRFANATIKSSDTVRIQYQADGEKKPRSAKRSDVRLFSEADVSDKPLTFAREPAVETDETVRIARSGRYTYIMLPAKEKAQPQAAVPPEIPRGASPAASPGAVPGAAHIPTPEEVRDVLKLDSAEKRDRFAGLDDENRRQVLIAAGNIAGVKNVSPLVSIKALKRHIILFDKQKIREWLIGKADAAGVDGLLETLKPPKARRDIVKMAYAGLSPEDQKTAKDVSRKISAQGQRALSDKEQEFVKRNRLIFGED
jgi:hypothetical protein